MSTIAVPTVLVAFNWPAASNRYQRVARFVDYLFSRIDKLQAPGFDPKWKSINLAATVPGLDPLPGGAGMAGSSGARSAGVAMKTARSPVCRVRGRERIALAQGAGDPMAQLRACSLMEHAERLECLDKLSRTHRRRRHRARRRRRPTTGSSARPPRPWTIRPSSSPPRRLAAARMAPRCSSRFSAAVAAPNWWSPDRPSPGSGEDYVISYRVNDGQPVELAAGTPSSGTGVAFTGDVVRLLQSLPEDGDIAVRVSHPGGCCPGGAFFARRTEDGAGEAGRRHANGRGRCQAAQLMVIEQRFRGDT